MRNSGAGWAMSAAGAMLLVACAEAPVAPTPNRDVLATYGPCGVELMTKVGAPSAPIDDVALSTGVPIRGMTIHATYSGATFGLPFSLVQAMNFGPRTDFGFLSCLAAPGESFDVAESDLETDRLPPPEGVDPTWWNSLSPREQRVLLKWADAIMKQFPGAYRSPGAVISELFKGQIEQLKTKAKLRALDLLPDPGQAELLAGGIYGCLLYQRYSRDPNAPFSNAEVLELASSLTGAFGEAQFARRPLTGLRFGRNGVFGAGLASADGFGTDCGWLVFRSIGGAILVTDPYEGGANQPSGSNGEDR